MGRPVGLTFQRLTSLPSEQNMSAETKTAWVLPARDSGAKTQSPSVWSSSAKGTWDCLVQNLCDGLGICLSDVPGPANPMQGWNLPH